MTATRDTKRLIEAERLVLRALCHGTPQGPVRESARRILGNYSWQEVLHQAVFDAAMSIPAEDPQLIRDQLPARLTRKGFPDFDLDDFVKPPGLSREEVEMLMHQMKCEST